MPRRRRLVGAQRPQTFIFLHENAAGWALDINERGLIIWSPAMVLRPPSPSKLSESKEKRPSRGRPRSIDSERLLAVAREVFLERGIRATTLEVAERAGVSEGSLFHRFKSKEALFSAAMDFDQESAPDRLLAALHEVEELDPPEALLRLSTAVLEVGKVALPIMMMSWSNPHLCGGTPFDKKKARFRDFLKALGAYFERQMDGGKLRRMDAEVLARTFLGAVHHYCMTRMLDETERAMIPEGMFVRGLVDLILNGAAPLEVTTPSLPKRRVATPKSRGT